MAVVTDRVHPASGPSSAATMAGIGRITKAQQGHEGHKDCEDTRTFHRSFLCFHSKLFQTPELAISTRHTMKWGKHTL